MIKKSLRARDIGDHANKQKAVAQESQATAPFAAKAWTELSADDKDQVLCQIAVRLGLVKSA